VIENVSIGQGEQVFDPRIIKVPASHGAQKLAPCAEVVPLGHARQTEISVHPGFGL
jgi:hypothetical protein